MKWSIEQGKVKGRPPTKDQQEFLNSEPGRGDQGIQMLCDIYAKLSTTRHVGQNAVGPIPVTAIWEYIDRAGLTDEAGLVVEQVVLAVDADTMRRQLKPKPKA